MFQFMDIESVVSIEMMNTSYTLMVNSIFNYFYLCIEER